MENTPEAAGAAPAPQTEATPTNSNPEPAQAPDMHGFTSEQLADMQKFFQANGGYDIIDFIKGDITEIKVFDDDGIMYK